MMSEPPFQAFSQVPLAQTVWGFVPFTLCYSVNVAFAPQSQSRPPLFLPTPSRLSFERREPLERYAVAKTLGSRGSQLIMKREIPVTRLGRGTERFGALYA